MKTLTLDGIQCLWGRENTCEECIAGKTYVYDGRQEEKYHAWRDMGDEKHESSYFIGYKIGDRVSEGRELPEDTYKIAYPKIQDVDDPSEWADQYDMENPFILDDLPYDA